MKNSGYLPDAKRAKEKLSQCLSKVENHTPNKDVKALFLCSPSDEGVMRNLGRNGTKYGPKTILNHFSQLTKHNNNSFQYDNVTNQNDEINDFNNAQKSQSENIKNYIEQNIIHLGGGHDHVYPLLKAIETKYKKIIILNIDPHCDTRESEHNHSGTPFRQFLSETKSQVTLYQYGTQEFANSPSTLKGIKQKIFSFQDIYYESKNFTELPLNFLHEVTNEADNETCFIFSLDADVISSEVMSGVSAVAHQGLPAGHVRELILWLKEYPLQKVFGIYEYNPVYDDHAKGARFLSSLIYEYLN